MTVSVQLPDDLAAKIDTVSSDRSAFVTEAVRRLLSETRNAGSAEDLARINAVADELNREAAEVLEYQVIQ